MSMYGREALRRLREQQSGAAQEQQHQPSLLAQIPGDAPMDDATVTVWDGERFVAYEKWLATAPIVREENRPATGADALPADAACVTTECGGTKVWLVRDGERWLMYVGSRRRGRRRDFCSPYLDHAIRTAEAWYGAPGGGWRVEKGRDGTGTTETADLSPQDSIDERRTGERGHDDLDLGGR